MDSRNDINLLFKIDVKGFPKWFAGVVDIYDLPFSCYRLVL